MGLFDAIKSIGKKAVEVITGGGATGLGSVIGGIPGALIGGAVDLGAKYLGNKFISEPNAERAFENSLYGTAYAFDRSREAYKSRYQDTMQDMAAAGLNPILAAGSGGFQVGNSVQMQTPQSFQAQIPNIEPASAYAAMTQAESNAADIVKKRLEWRKISQETLKTLADKEKTMAETAKIHAETAGSWADYRNRLQDFKIKMVMVERVLAEAYKDISIRNLNAAKIDEIKQNIQNLQKSAALLEMQGEILNRESYWYKEDHYNILGLVKAVMGALNLHLGAFVPIK